MLTSIISRLESCRVLVIGDLLLDTYTIGKARRISPEAPVAVLQVEKEEHRPGGAGNVILNLVSLGAQVIAVGRIGQDNPGEMLKQSLVAENVDVRGIVVQNGFSTPVKNRIIADNQQIVRVDHEKTIPLPEQLEQQLIDRLSVLMEDVSVVAISDYGKGFLSSTLLGEIIELAKEKGIPVISDPKGIDFAKYRGTTVIKPNLSEAYAAANLSLDAPLEKVATKVLNLTQADILMVTRSEAGISIFHKNGERQDYPVKVREVKDVTGAGDTVLAMLACAMANGLNIGEAAQLSNAAAGLAIERLGCARVSLSEIAHRLLEDDIVNKVFDTEHMFALQEVLRGRPFNLLCLSGENGLTPQMFKMIKNIGRKNACELLVYINDSKPEEEFVDLLASLQEIKFIIINSESLHSLFQHIQPHEIYSVSGKECKQLESIEQILL